MANGSISSCLSFSLGRDENGIDEGRRCAKNIPWQKIFHKRVAPVCTAVIDERERNGGTDAGLFKAFGPTNKGETKHITDVADEKVVVQVVRDARKPPSDMAFDQITLLLEDPDRDQIAPIKSSSDGIYLVREASSFSLSLNEGCINERLFMDKKRENYKSKGWGIGNWRVWLALEDIDAARKKRKKAEIAMLTGSKKRKKAEIATECKKQYSVLTPPTNVKRSLSSNQHDVDSMATSKRVKGSGMEPTFSSHQYQYQHSMNVLFPRMPLEFNQPQLLAPTSFISMPSQLNHHQHFLASPMPDTPRRVNRQILKTDMALMPQITPHSLQPGLSTQMPNMKQVWLTRLIQIERVSLTPSLLMSPAPSLTSLLMDNITGQSRRS